MPRLPAVLRRFRRLVAPPGRPAEALGVPASGEDLESELSRAFAELDSIAAEADRIGARSREEASRRRAEAAREEASLVEEARARATGERVRAAAGYREKARRDADSELVSARERADRIRARGRERIPKLVEEVVACVKQAER